MTVATLGAFGVGEFAEGVSVMLFYKIGEYLQERAVKRSRRSIKEMMDLKPDYANLIREGKIVQVSPEQVKPGDKIIIKPGERIPLDGRVIKGKSRLDTSSLTGESVTRAINKGDKVLAGAINKNSVLTVEVIKEYRESTVSRILNLVEEASNRKAATEKFITKFARYYTPAVVGIAAFISLIPPLIFPGSSFSNWLYRGLVFLVISCPCALVISIPLGYFAGIGRASRDGILVKGGNYLEGLANITRVIFDKTGTLSRGVFRVQEVSATGNYTGEKLLKLAATAEYYSHHPVADSIKEAYGKEPDLVNIEGYNEIPGQGIEATINGKEILLGNKTLMEREKVIGFKEASGEGSIVYVAVNKDYAGYIIISDELKSDSKKAIRSLKKLGIEDITMFTGDREKTAAAVSKRLGLDNYEASLLPGDKVAKLEEVLNGTYHGRVAFVGDGINDAPVLARADIGIAMGGLGSDAAVEAADVVIMTDEPSKLGKAIFIARRTRSIVWQNIVMSLGIKFFNSRSRFIWSSYYVGRCFCRCRGCSVSGTQFYQGFNFKKSNLKVITLN